MDPLTKQNKASRRGWLTNIGVILAGALFIALYGCSAGSSTPGTPGSSTSTYTYYPAPTPTPVLGGPTRVRLVQAAPNTPNVDILVDNDVVLSNVGFGTGTNYLTIASGNRRVRVRQTGTSTILFDKTYILPASDSMTLLSLPGSNNVDFQVTEDQLNLPPASGMVKVNIFHADAAAGNLDVYITNPGEDLNATLPAFSNVAYKSPPHIFTTDPGNMQVRFTVAGTKNVVLDTGGFSVPDGKTRTVVVIGDPGKGIAYGEVFLNDD